MQGSQDPGVWKYFPKTVSIPGLGIRLKDKRRQFSELNNALLNGIDF
jgi:hypothetical protein